MSENNIKSIQITGGAELIGGRKRRLSKKRDKGGLPVAGPTVNKRNQEGGATDCGPTGYTAPSKAAEGPIDQVFKLLTQPGQNPADPIPKLSVSAMPGPGLMQGGAKRRIELRKAQPTKKVQLHSKKPIVAAATKPAQKHHKKTRKIVLGLVSLQKRQTRAKKISEKMKEMPLDRLKKQLVEQGLIKTTSKAPESVLRQIAADAQIVGGNGL
jgi:hypothetical protein